MGHPPKELFRNTLFYEKKIDVEKKTFFNA
jgi:hypothetical protein